MLIARKRSYSRSPCSMRACAACQDSSMVRALRRGARPAAGLVGNPRASGVVAQVGGGRLGRALVVAEPAPEDRRPPQRGRRVLLARPAGGERLVVLRRVIELGDVLVVAPD